MITKKVLAKFGTTNDKIRRVFTAEDPETDEFKARKRFEEKLCGRLTTGIEFSMANSYLYSVSDLAWDSAPILKQNIPLILYAQQKIKLEECRKELDKLGCASEFIKEKDGKSYVDLPRFYEVAVNLVRSYITRRVAPQATRVTGLHPFFKYEPRATDQVGKLRADALSQRIEIMTDQYGYRHLITQVIRNMFLYGHTVVFPQCSWDREVQYRLSSEDGDPESYVRREGVPFILPHPSRVFWDRSQPLSTLNFDTGCEYVGFWDIVKYKDIERNPAYFNRQRIRITETGRNLAGRFGLFLETQFNAQRISFPTSQGNDISGANDQRNAYSFYSQATADESMFLSEYFEKVIPAEVGLGDYPSPVWLRLVVAADDSVIYGEFLPSLPAVYFGYNANDARLLNIAPAHEIMPWQDQVSNLLSQLLLTSKAGALKVISIDTDALGEESDEVRSAVRKTLEGRDYYVHPLVLEYSGNKSRALGVDPKSPISLQELEMQKDITQYFRSITNLLSIIERLLTLSPQELGQAAPREITATEASEIAQSTNTVYNFISDAVDEGRATWKRLLYEATVSCATEKVEVPIVNQYPNDVIHRAGFTLTSPESSPGGVSADMLTITGTPQALVHEYVFSSRDGDDRPSNQQAASMLIQLSQALLTNPAVMQAVGKRKLFEIFNEIFRKSGAGVDLKLEVPEGEPDQFGPDPALMEQIVAQLQQLQQQIQELGQQSSQAEQTAASAEQTVAKQEKELAATSAQVNELLDLFKAALQGSPNAAAASVPATPDIMGNYFTPIA